MKRAALAICAALLASLAASPVAAVSHQGRLRSGDDKPCALTEFWTQTARLCAESQFSPSKSDCKRAMDCLGNAGGAVADNIQAQQDARFDQVPANFQCKDATKSDVEKSHESAEACMRACQKNHASCVGADYRGKTDGCFFCTSSAIIPVKSKQPEASLSIKYDGSVYESQEREMTCDNKDHYKNGDKDFGECQQTCTSDTNCRGFVFYLQEGEERYCWHCQDDVLRKTVVKGCKDQAGEKIPCCTTFLKIAPTAEEKQQLDTLPDLVITEKTAGLGWGYNAPINGQSSKLASDTEVRFPDKRMKNQWGGNQVRANLEHRLMFDEGKCQVDLKPFTDPREDREGNPVEDEACYEPHGGTIGMGIAERDATTKGITKIWVTGGLQVRIRFSEPGSDGPFPTSCQDGKCFTCSSLRWRYTICKLPAGITARNIVNQAGI